MEKVYKILRRLQVFVKPPYKIQLFEGDELYKVSIAFVQIRYLLICYLLLNMYI